MKTCCVTGHRTLPQGQIQNIRQSLEQEVENAIQDGYRCFISGFAEGTDMLFAEIILAQRERYPRIFLEAAIPYPKTGSKNYRNLLRQCNGIAYIGQSYHPGIYHQRNREMVRAASRVIAVYDGRGKGGTFFTIRYANILEKDVKIIHLL